MGRACESRGVSRNCSLATASCYGELGFAALYRYGPDRPRAKWRWGVGVRLLLPRCGYWQRVDYFSILGILLLLANHIHFCRYCCADGVV